MALTLGSDGQLLVTPEKTAQEKLLQEWSEQIAAMPPKNPPTGIMTSVGYVNPATGENYSQGTGPVPVENELPNLYPDGNPGQGRWTPYGWNPNAAAVSDDASSRDSEYVAQLQQHTPYWEREENKMIKDAALANADRTDGTLRVTSDMEGYEDRADIQAWLEANPALKDQFLKDRARKADAGLLRSNPNAVSIEVTPEDISALQADWGGNNLSDADASAYISGQGIESTFSPAQQADEFVRNKRNEIQNFLAASKKYNQRR